MKIAIIGAGVSGLATAYYLSRKQCKQLGIESVTVYEKSIEVGGNANTFEVELQDGSKRWVDMGVNDFNKATYNHMVQLWEELGIMNDNYCRPLINQESFWPGGTSNIKYSIDENDKVHPGDGSGIDATEFENLISKFRDELHDWYENAGQEGDDTITVGDWLDKKFGDNKKFIEYNLYPRMNGMYYTMEENNNHEAPASQMPLWMVAHYYILQEGYGLKDGANATTRQYFVDGSSKWLKFLADKIQKENLEEGNIPVKIFTGRPNTHIDRDTKNKRLAVIEGSTFQQYADIVIFATHANDTDLIIDEPVKTEPRYSHMIKQLKEFTYSECTIIAHEDPSYVPVIPPDNIKTAYNIHKYDYSQGNKWPYTITYVVNYHQNDPTPLPLLYVTVNPYNGRPAKIAARVVGTKVTGPAEAKFKHCKLDDKAMRAQVEIGKTQLGTVHDKTFEIYFAGSFSIGAGLHEECIIQAQQIAKKILTPPLFMEEHTYRLGKGEKHFAPEYIRKNLKRK